MKQQKKKAVLYLLAGLVICGAVLYPLAAGEPAAALEGSVVQPLSGQTTPEVTDIAEETPERSAAQSPSTSTADVPEKKEAEKIPVSDTSSPTEEEAIPAPVEPETEPDAVPTEQSEASALEREAPAEQEDSPPEVVGYITSVDITQDEHDAYLIERWLVDGKYPRNQFGESYARSPSPSMPGRSRTSFRFGPPTASGAMPGRRISTGRRSIPLRRPRPTWKICRIPGPSRSMTWRGM